MESRGILRAELFEGIKDKISSRSAVVSVIGLGYVGLPLAVAFADAGYLTIGVESNHLRLDQLKSGKSYIRDGHVELRLPELAMSDRLQVREDIPEAVKGSDCVAICVPTPLGAANKPDTSTISDVLKITGKNLTEGKLVIIESSVYPGFTDEVAKRYLEVSKLKCGVDFGLAYAPERIDPGNRRFYLTAIPKIVGGVDESSGEIAKLLYQSVIKAEVIKVRDARTAESVKMLENAYRYVNIAFVNELALLLSKIGVNSYEVISAASTKPFGFQPHYPGPGIGGECIPKDPFYLNHVARRAGIRLNILEASAKVNEMVPHWVVSRVLEELKVLGKKSAKVSVFGLAYKAESTETTHSPAIKIISYLASRKIQLALYDPYVQTIGISRRVWMSEATAEAAAAKSDCLLFLVDHQAFRRLDLSALRKVAAEGCFVFDTRNLFNAEDIENAGFRYLGLGKP